MTAGASAVVEELGGWDHGSLPASVLAVTTSARTTNRSTTTRVPSRTGHWLTVRAMPLGGRVEGTSQSAATLAPVSRRRGAVVLTIETALQAEVGEMTVVARGADRA